VTETRSPSHLHGQNLAAGGTTTCTGTYTTDQGDVDHGSVTNNASVTGTPAAGNLAPATDSLTIDAAGPA